uniref:DAG1 domain-containing protein n=1 Tax=Strongyloides stercoralis TaxID=6248 RepID=A0A0K0E7S5_STRER
MDKEKPYAHIIPIIVIVLIIGIIALIFGCFKLKQWRKKKQAEKLKYISLYSKRENGDEVIGKHYVPLDNISVPKTYTKKSEDSSTEADQ